MKLIPTCTRILFCLGFVRVGNSCMSVIVIPPAHTPQEGSQPWTAVVVVCRRDFVPSEQMGWETWLSIMPHRNFSHWKMMLFFFFFFKRRGNRDGRLPGGWQECCCGGTFSVTLGKVSAGLLWGMLHNSCLLSPDMPPQVKIRQHMSCWQCFGLPWNERHNMKVRLYLIYHV